jgi:hypothetical protein
MNSKEPPTLIKVKASMLVATATWASMPNATITGTVMREVLPVTTLITLVRKNTMTRVKSLAPDTRLSFTVPLKALQIIIAVAMIGVAVFSLLNKNLGQASHDVPASWFGVVAGYAITFLLAIYGGFFSGGYVTMLTAAFVLLFGMTFLQAVASTKVINVFSSGVATLNLFGAASWI